MTGLGQVNHMVIAKPLFSKSAVLNVFSVRTKSCVEVKRTGSLVRNASQENFISVFVTFLSGPVAELSPSKKNSFDILFFPRSLVDSRT